MDKLTQHDAINLVSQYAVAMRTNNYADDDIRQNLGEVGCTPQTIEFVFQYMNDNNVTKDYNSRPAGLGWLAVVAALAVTIGSCVLFVLKFKSSSVIQIPIFVLLSCVLGFFTYGSITLLCQRLGLTVSRSRPLDLPNKDHIRKQIATLDEDASGSYFTPVVD